MVYQNLLTETKNQIFYITINREPKLNALNRETLTDLHHAVTQALEDKTVLGIILTGAGSKAFVAGADISEFANYNAEEGRELACDGQNKVFNLLSNCPKPIVAAINGFALGGGLELAMACHIRIASSTAKLGLPEVSLGLIPGYGGTQRLTQLVGKGRALEIILSAEMIDATEAHRIGLVNKVASPESLLTEAEALLSKIMSRSPVALACAIRAVNAVYQDSVNGFDTEINEFAKCFSSADFKEGVSAFLEKRKPNFSGY